MSGDTGVLSAKTIRVAGPEVSRPRSGSKQGAKESLKKIDKKAFSEAKSVPGVSVFAVIGTFIVSTLMVFVVLAQINYNETAAQSVRLNSQVRDLTEKHRTLSLAFESSFDISEVERIAQEELGMTKPSAGQVVNVTVIPHDSAIVIIGEEKNSGQGFIEFLKSLTSYFTQ